MPTPPASTQSSLLIVIVNYATAELTVDCLASLEPELSALPNTRVVVTDNLSPDDSADQIEQAIADNKWSSWCEMMRLERNGGFAYGNNAAIGPALQADGPPDFVLLLNPDTVVRPGAVAALLAFMAEHPQVGLCGSRLEDPDGTVQRSAFRFPTLRSEFDNAMRFGPISRLFAARVVAPPPPQDSCPVEWVSGASMLVRREVFDAVGLLDESYFMYYEELDFCRRAWDAGYGSWYVPASRVVHLVGQASGVGTPNQKPKRRPRYWFASRRRYFVRHHGFGKTLLIDLLWSLGYGVFRLRAWLQRKPVSDPPHLGRDFVAYNLLGRRTHVGR